MDEAEELGTIVDPRNVLMDEIAANARADRDANMAEADTTIIEEGDGEDLDVVDNLGESDDNSIVSRDDQQYLVLNVNGEDQEISIEDAIKQLQIGGNAAQQTKLAVEATRNANASKDKYEALTEELQATRSAKSTQPDDSEELKAEALVDIKESIKKMYVDGDTDGLAESLVDKLLTPSAAPAHVETGVSTEDVNELLLQHDLKRDIKTAFDSFENDEAFKEVTSDPHLMKIVDFETDQLMKDTTYMAENPSYQDIFEKAGETVRDKYVQAPITADTVNDIAEKKRQAPKSVASRSVRRPGVPEPQKPPTKSEIIQGIATGRGQNTLS